MGLGPVFVLEIEMEHQEEFSVVQENCLERLSKQDEEKLQTTKKLKKSHKSKEDDCTKEGMILSSVQIEETTTSKQQMTSSNLTTTNDHIEETMTSTHNVLEESVEQQQAESRDEGRIDTVETGDNMEIEKEVEQQALKINEVRKGKESITKVPLTYSAIVAGNNNRPNEFQQERYKKSKELKMKVLKEK